jgi:hypothetical protein
VWYCTLLPIVDGLLSTHNNEQEAFNWVSPFIITTMRVSELLRQDLQTSFLKATTLPVAWSFVLLLPSPFVTNLSTKNMNAYELLLVM